MYFAEKEIMSRDFSIIEISSESDTDIECSVEYPNPFDAISKIEVIDDDDDDDTIDDDDVEIVSITEPTSPPAPSLSIAASLPPAPAPKTGGYISTLTIGWSRN